MIQKRILVPQRLRQPPATGWSWVDRRFLREHGDYLSREAILLYFFFVAVADRHGLSCYSDTALTSRLQLMQPVLERAREELLDRDLIAYQLPLVQVLSLPSPGVRRCPQPGQGLMLLGEVLRQATATPSPDDALPAQAVGSQSAQVPIRLGDRFRQAGAASASDQGRNTP
jgi:hypothetical protein